MFLKSGSQIFFPVPIILSKDLGPIMAKIGDRNFQRKGCMASDIHNIFNVMIDLIT